MILTSKFDLNQKVWKIWRLTEVIGMPCAVCNGTGRLMLVNGNSVACTNSYFGTPRCDNGQVRTELVFRWAITGVLTIGQITMRASVQHTYESPRDNATEYMCCETGVGSGTVHDENDLFAVQDEALEECARRNVGCDIMPTENTIAVAYNDNEEWDAWIVNKLAKEA